MADQGRVPNRVLRRIREQERQESRSEFAAALSAKAAEMRISVAPSERYVARLEDGDTRHPQAAYRRVLSALCGRPYEELGFDSPYSQDDSGSVQVEASGMTLLRSLVTARHWQKFSTFETQFRRAASELSELEGEPSLARISVSSRQYERWIYGTVKTEPWPEAARVLEHMFGYPVRQLLSPSGIGSSAQPAVRPTDREAGISRSPGTTLIAHDEITAGYAADASAWDKAEELRRELEDTIASGTVSSSRLAFLDEMVAGHLKSYTTSPPADSLARLMTDSAGVRRLCAERQPAIVQARLSEITAVLSTLIADALMKLGRVADSRAWYGTARIAADDSGKATIMALVRTQQAMLPYYYGSPDEAVRLAQDAQIILGEEATGEAAAFAAAAEARALARIGDRVGARVAIARSRDLALSASQPDNDEAFRFAERRLLFYDSSTFSNIGDSKDAIRAQEEALALYHNDARLIDPALIRLDRAELTAMKGELSDVPGLVQEAVSGISQSRLTLLLAARIRQISGMIPDGHRARHPLMEIRREIANRGD